MTSSSADFASKRSSGAKVAARLTLDNWAQHRQIDISKIRGTLCF
ncbi:hypothetical protein [Edaphovirga cremea]